MFKDSDLDDYYRVESACYSSDEATMEKILLLSKSELIPYYQDYGFLYNGKSKSGHGGFKYRQKIAQFLGQTLIIEYSTVIQ